MDKIGTGGGGGGPALARPDGPSDTGPEPRTSTPLSIDFNGRIHAVDTDRGTYYQVDNEDPLVVQHRPVEPKTTIDVTDPNARAKSYLVESLVTQDSAVNPVIGLPTVDLSAHEPEPAADSPFFPARIASVESSATPAGPRDDLTVTPRSTRDTTHRLIRTIGGKVLRSPSNDFDPPTIRRVDGNVLNGSF